MWNQHVSLIYSRLFTRRTLAVHVVVFPVARKECPVDVLKCSVSVAGDDPVTQHCLTSVLAAVGKHKHVHEGWICAIFVIMYKTATGTRAIDLKYKKSPEY